METSTLICSANQWTGFYMISVFVMKELRRFDALRQSFTKILQSILVLQKVPKRGDCPSSLSFLSTRDIQLLRYHKITKI